MLRPSASPVSSRKPSWITPGFRNLQFPSAPCTKTWSLCSLPAPFAVALNAPACLRPGLSKVALSSFTASPHHCHIPNPLYRCTLVPTQGGLPPSPTMKLCLSGGQQPPEAKSISECHLNTEKGGCRAERDMARFPEKCCCLDCCGYL